ncbi:Lrp/AsnC family transcriptional regulator [Rhodococcus spelaei]|uniref:Lrp/AsnC family transcriptional regulator n=1 Tax=Rhodococcus spelaei TaxID=2546320 RepID=UPI001FEB7165|nr:AsnC family transcriptional regulator [Rhodococcus spelaei]
MNTVDSQEFAGRDDVDEIDLALINTLQLDPRAPWSTVGKALGVDPVTAARRWSRLVEAGIAWVTAHPGGPQIAAFIEIDCDARRVQETAAALARWPHVMTVEHTSGGRDLLLTVGVPDLTALSRYVLDSIGPLDGVRATRTHLVTRPYAVGGDWRLRSLDAEQRAHLGSSGRAGSRMLRPLDETERQLVRRLCVDGRTSLTDLAAGLGRSVSTVRRRLQTMVASGSVVFRCDVAQPLSGWPVSLWVWGRVPADESESIARKLVTLPETRACMAMTGGSTNFLYCTWLRSLDNAQRLEQLLAERTPSLRIVDRTVALGFTKRMGRLLDSAGRSTGVVPMDVWSDPVEAARLATGHGAPTERGVSL